MVPNRNDLCSVELLSSFFKKLELGSGSTFWLKTGKSSTKARARLGHSSSDFCSALVEVVEVEVRLDDEVHRVTRAPRLLRGHRV